MKRVYVYIDNPDTVNELLYAANEGGHDVAVDGVTEDGEAVIVVLVGVSR